MKINSKIPLYALIANHLINHSLINANVEMLCNGDQDIANKNGAHNPSLKSICKILSDLDREGISIEQRFREMLDG